ncbi:MAG: hypothetical protein M1361_02485 [Patescibacteria group bacterium]|nr:hypothetical protein [Patescibacteria group bacterium]MCL5224443.1 hypothetical protein [Patescibacteria group bacterium]
MSIIQPNKRKSVVMLIAGLSVMFALFIVGNIVIYSKTVNINHDLAALEGNMSNLQVQNAELRTNLYTETDSDALSKIIAAKGLVEDKNPQWVIASAQ